MNNIASNCLTCSISIIKIFYHAVYQVEQQRVRNICQSILKFSNGHDCKCGRSSIDRSWQKILKLFEEVRRSTFQLDICYLSRS